MYCWQGLVTLSLPSLPPALGLNFLLEITLHSQLCPCSGPCQAALHPSPEPELVIFSLSPALIPAPAPGKLIEQGQTQPEGSHSGDDTQRAVTRMFLGKDHRKGACPGQAREGVALSWPLSGLPKIPQLFLLVLDSVENS